MLWGFPGGTELVAFDLTDRSNIRYTVDCVEPDEMYKLAAYSFVGISFEQPITIGELLG